MRAHDARRVAGASHRSRSPPKCSWSLHGTRLLHGDLDAVPLPRGLVTPYNAFPLHLSEIDGPDELCNVILRPVATTTPESLLALPATSPPPRPVEINLYVAVIVDLERQVTLRIAAATSNAERPEPSAPGPDELAWDGGTRRVGYRQTRNRVVGPLRGKFIFASRAPSDLRNGRLLSLTSQRRDDTELLH